MDRNVRHNMFFYFISSSCTVCQIAWPESTDVTFFFFFYCGEGGEEFIDVQLDRRVGLDNVKLGPYSA